MTIESPRSRTFRRVTGIAAITAWLAVFACAALDWRGATTVLAVIAVCVPPISFVGHLGYTDVLTPAQKTLWRRQIRSKRRMLVAQFRYLFAEDLPAATARLSGPAPAARHPRSVEA